MCINGVSVKALVDTGATVTVIDDDFRLSHSNLSALPLEQSNVKVNAAGNQTLECLGSMKVTITTLQGTFDVNILVIRNLVQKVILGCDFMTTNGVVIEMNSSVLA